MIIPSVDIRNGKAVQLVGGKELAVDAGSPQPILKKFARVGEVAVIDLDAAMSIGSNRSEILPLLENAACRVGGGIRDVKTAISWLDAGAAKVILGTAARSEVLQQLPRERVIAALDAVHDEHGRGKVVDHGWQNNTGQDVVERISQLRGQVGGFLITFVEREGRLLGIDKPTIARYSQAADGVPVTIAGGVSTAQEIAELDQMGIEAQVGMAIYTGKLSLADAFAAPLISDRPDGLWPTVVVNESGQALGLAYSSPESLSKSLHTGTAHYWSRKRGLWKKGETSGNTQQLIAVATDCDRDALRFIVKQTGTGFCHLDQPTCFGDETGLTKLQSQLRLRQQNAPENSYVRQLFESDELLNAKIVEEARELALAESRNELIHETADVLFFTFAKMVKADIELSDIEQELLRRSRKVSRRGGSMKPRHRQRQGSDTTRRSCSQTQLLRGKST